MSGHMHRSGDGAQVRTTLATMGTVALTRAVVACGSSVQQSGCPSACGSPLLHPATPSSPAATETASTRTPGFHHAGQLGVAVAFQTATLLGDGSVLIAGGTIWGSTASSAAYRYDRKTGAIVESGRMAQPRWGQTATLLPDGEVLVSGGATTYHGEIGSVTARAELYNPHSNQWRQAASMSIPRYVHQAALLTDGRVLVAGGWSFTANSDPSKSSAEIYDPHTDTWAATGSLATARAEFVMLRVGDGRVLAVDGIDANYRLLSTSEVFDPTTGAWKASGKLQVALMWPAAALLQDGRVLIAGGATDIGGSGRTATCELYAPAPR